MSEAAPAAAGSGSDPGTVVRMTPRRLGAVLALLAAFLVMAGTFTPAWLVAPAPAEGGVGLTGVELCERRGGERVCVSRDWDELLADTRDKDLKLVAQAVVVAVAGSIGVAGLLLGVGLGGLTTQRRLALATALAILGSVLALCGAIATVVILHEFYRREAFEYGYSIFLYGAGCGVGVVGCALIRRRGGGGGAAAGGG